MSSRTKLVARLASTLSLAAVLVAATSTPAHAQLMKRIKQAAADKAVDKAVDRAGDKVAPTQAAAASPAAATGSSSSLVVIDDARITAFIAAMQPVVDASRQLVAERAAKKQLETYQTCAANAMLKPPAQISDAKQAELDRIVDQVSKLTEKMVANYASMDSVKINALNDSIQVLSDIQQRAIYPAMAQCGKRPRPVPAGVRVNFDGTIAGVTPAKVPGMTPAQFGRMRERIALYVINPDRPNDLRPEEKSAIDARAKDLGEITAGFRGQAMAWATWSELWSAWK